MSDAPMVKCPGCDLQLSDDDPWAQIAHMEDNHPEIIEERLREIGTIDPRRTAAAMLYGNDRLNPSSNHRALGLLERWCSTSVVKTRPAECLLEETHSVLRANGRPVP